MRIFKERSRLIAAFAAMACILCLASPARAASPAKPPTDQEISFAVDEALVLSSMIPANELDVKTVAGVVTLSGTVDDLLAKDEAVKIATTIRGVRDVINEIKVKPAARTDAALRKDVEDALHYDDTTNSLSLAVTVHEGSVTLAGKTPSWIEQQAAIFDAMRIPGVNEVNHEISIVYANERTDQDIQADVRRALMLDSWVDSALIGVEVENAKVSLSGTVGSISERDHVESDGWISGVRAVDASALKVDPSFKQDRRKRENSSPDTDEHIKVNIQTALHIDLRIMARDIQVTVFEGRVTLAGTVHHLSSKLAAQSDAKDRFGVISVRNLIKVRPQIRPSDEHLAMNVKQSLIRDSRVGCFDLQVAASNGIVTLTGNVDYEPQKWEAEAMAERAVGAVGVRDYLLVTHAAVSP